ncbi:MAG: hypothetical protein IPO65_19065 [Saprospiraceae bacterium]|nr:hypothetical protein [Saprospiraceae bacterium]
MTKTFILILFAFIAFGITSCTDDVTEITDQGVPVLDESFEYQNPRLPLGPCSCIQCF